MCVVVTPYFSVTSRCVCPALPPQLLHHLHGRSLIGPTRPSQKQQSPHRTCPPHPLLSCHAEPPEQPPPGSATRPLPPAYPGAGPPVQGQRPPGHVQPSRGR